MNEPISQTGGLRAWLDRQRADFDAGKPKFVEQYLAIEPRLADDPELLPDLVYAEYRFREAAGDAPSPEAYLTRFPQLRPQLEPLFEVHLAMLELSADDFSPCPPATAQDRETGAATGTFIQQIQENGIITASRLAHFIPPKALPESPEDLVRRLIESGNLTTFQADYLLRGKAEGLIFGNYLLLDKIGAGGMGQVFKAQHRRMHRIVAIKMLPREVTQDQAAVARFQREVHAAAKLRHTHIVAADDADEANGIHFLVMEYVDGNDLLRRVSTGGPLPVDKAVNYVLQAARGLAFAHKKGVIHRDVKPANLLLDADETVKILDLGLARLQTPSESQLALTGTGTVMGTVDYMSPEQAHNPKTADARADIYSLGCTLFFLITGKVVYEGRAAIDKMLAHWEQPVPLLMDAQPQVPEELELIFQRMLAKKIEDRYQSMDEVVTALERCHAAMAARVRSLPISKWRGTSASVMRSQNIDSDNQRSWSKTNSKPALSGRSRIALTTAGVLGLIALATVLLSLVK